MLQKTSARFSGPRVPMLQIPAAAVQKLQNSALE